MTVVVVGDGGVEIPPSVLSGHDVHSFREGRSIYCRTVQLGSLPAFCGKRPSS